MSGVPCLAGDPRVDEGVQVRRLHYRRIRLVRETEGGAAEAFPTCRETFGKALPGVLLGTAGTQGGLAIPHRRAAACSGEGVRPRCRSVPLIRQSEVICDDRKVPAGDEVLLQYWGNHTGIGVVPPDVAGPAAVAFPKGGQSPDTKGGQSPKGHKRGTVPKRGTQKGDSPKGGHKRGTVPLLSWRKAA